MGGSTDRDADFIALPLRGGMTESLHRAERAGDPAARGLLDDAAVLEIGGATLVLTHDMIVEGVHFLPDDPPGDVAWKLLAVNLSDLAAKGARPVGALLGYTPRRGGMGPGLRGRAGRGAERLRNRLARRRHGARAGGRAAHARPHRDRRGDRAGAVARGRPGRRPSLGQRHDRRLRRRPANCSRARSPGRPRWSNAIAIRGRGSRPARGWRRWSAR